MNPQALSNVLRTAGGVYLWCRHGIIGTSFIATAYMQLVGLYQVGLIRRLPEPPLPSMDSEKVDAAAEAYHRCSLPMPDAYLGAISYSITAALAALAGADRVERHPWIPLSMGTKVLVDAVQAGRLSKEQWSKHGAFCFWCLVAAGVTFAAVPLALPETFAALKRIIGRAMDKSKTYQRKRGRRATENKSLVPVVSLSGAAYGLGRSPLRMECPQSKRPDEAMARRSLQGSCAAPVGMGGFLLRRWWPALAFLLATLGNPAFQASGAEVKVMVDFPTDGSSFAKPAPRALIAGRIQVSGTLTPWLDLAIVIDRSGTTANPTGADIDGDGTVGELRKLRLLGFRLQDLLQPRSTDPDDSVLAAELAGARDLLKSLPRPTPGSA